MVNKMRLLSLILLIFGSFCSIAAGGVIYVDIDAPYGGTGSSWNDAGNDLQEALGDGQAGDEIRVAQGTYRPTVAGGDRGSSFRINSAIKVLGGYAGQGEPNPHARNVAEFRTVLSGDLNSDDIAVDKPDDLMTQVSRDENSYNVIKAGVFPGEAILEGFTITAGNADGGASAEKSGGGIYGAYNHGRLVVTNCIIEGNTAFYDGGGASFDGDLINCVIRNNFANYGGGIHGRGKTSGCIIENNHAITRGGGINVQGQANIIDCVIRNNTAESGGGLNTVYDLPIVERCIFAGNSATGNGGAVYSYNCDTCNGYPEFYSCLFVDNSCGGNGGAVSESGTAEIWLVNCTIWNNTAGDSAGGVHVDSRWNYQEWIVANCIIWGNSDQTGTGNVNAQIYPIGDDLGTGNLAYIGYRNCCIQGLDNNDNDNFALDPLFVDTGDEYDLHLSAGSPCIDRGNAGFYSYSGTAPTTGTGTGGNDPLLSKLDLGGYPRFAGSKVDLGAYEVPSPSVWYVASDPNSIRPATGRSWEDAFINLQHALEVAHAGDEIRIAKGIYNPAPSGGDRDATFNLKSNVTVKGGFAGPKAADPDYRNVSIYRTVLSGDLNGDDLPDWQNRTDNSLHVVTCNETREETMLDGLTVTAGYSYRDGDALDDDRRGGGVRVTNGDVTIIGCSFTDNYAHDEGGGLYNLNGSIMLNDCVFSENKVGQDGGGLQNDDGSPTLINCRFINNIAGDEGGGMCNEDERVAPHNPKLINCLFAWNSAGGYGGGLCNDESSPAIINCTFTQNSAPWGGAMHNEHHAGPTVTNSILRDNGSDEINDVESTTTVTYSNVQGSWEGIGNVDIDPLFVDAENGDFHLQSQAGRWEETLQQWILDDTTSLCIDSGNMASPIGFEPFANGGVLNMGAYGGTTQASKSYFGGKECEVVIVGDINGDCTVNLSDFALMAFHWLESGR